MKAGDWVTNSVAFDINTSDYNGELYVKCSTSVEVEAFKSTTLDADTQADKEMVTVKKFFVLPISFILGCRLGDFATIDFLDEFRWVGPKETFVYLEDGKSYEVEYPPGFNKIGQIHLTIPGNPPLWTGMPTKVYLSKPLTGNMVKRYFRDHNSTVKVGAVRGVVQWFVVKGMRSNVLNIQDSIHGLLDYAKKDPLGEKLEVYAYVQREDGFLAKINVILLSNEYSNRSQE